METFSRVEERRTMMSTTKRFWWGALAGIAGILLAVGTSQARVPDPLRPDPGVTTTTSAGIVVYPKIKVDTVCDGGADSGEICTCLGSITDGACAAANNCEGGTCRVIADTVVQLTNTAAFLTKTHCFYVNANGHCNNAPDTVCNDENFRDVCPSGGLCTAGWQETDFRLTLTKRQPLSWSANDGLPQLPLEDMIIDGQSNEGSIPPVAEVPFTGELRCIQVDTTNELPLDRNDLKGEATIVTISDSASGAAVDSAKYTAIGMPAIAGESAETTSNGATLNIGGPQADYNGCPNIITLNHFFDGAQVVTHDQDVSGSVESELTLVPCAADFLNQDQNLATSTIQFLIYNEFEQRFSTSTRVTCYREVRLSDIDTRPGPDGDNFSIFSASVQGTLTGQSRLRAVTGGDDDPDFGANGVLALLQENWAAGICSESTGGVVALCTSNEDCEGTCVASRVASDIVNVQSQGTRALGDRILMPIP
jgi:hypothetical protein